MYSLEANTFSIGAVKPKCYRKWWTIVKMLWQIWKSKYITRSELHGHHVKGLIELIEFLNRAVFLHKKKMLLWSQPKLNQTLHVVPARLMWSEPHLPLPQMNHKCRAGNNRLSEVLHSFQQYSRTLINARFSSACAWLSLCHMGI